MLAIKCAALEKSTNSIYDCYVKSLTADRRFNPRTAVSCGEAEAYDRKKGVQRDKRQAVSLSLRDRLRAT